MLLVLLFLSMLLFQITHVNYLGSYIPELRTYTNILYKQKLLCEMLLITIN